MSVTDVCPLIIDGRAIETPDRIRVVDKFSGDGVADVAVASRSHVSEAVRSALKAFRAGSPPPYDRYHALHRAAELVEQGREELIETIVSETGFTRSDATGEVSRTIQTLLLSAEEAKRIRGEMVPLEGAPGVTRRMGFTIRVPVGVVCAITPFNSPLNTVAHKIAPALAAGNSVVTEAGGGHPSGGNATLLPADASGCASRVPESAPRRRQPGRSVAARGARHPVLHLHGQHQRGPSDSTRSGPSSDAARAGEHLEHHCLRRYEHRMGFAAGA